ncbi:hypothetical protein ACFV16_22415 [Streptomyces massasporeus]|uniref:hypothetical protein n=1 Tax=Streptomyces massasporeus TaxID=67324 RepID=UPI0036B789FF
MSTPDDRKLLSLLDTLSPEHVARLKVLTDARTAVLPTPPDASADENPFAPDLTMSREVADYVLRAVAGLLHEGYWPKAYTGYGPQDADERGYDMALVLRAADIIGRENIRNSELLAALADLDSDDGGTS